MPRPEDRARQEIDRLLIQAGWVIQDHADLDLSEAFGVAVREYPLKTGYADYLLFVNRQAVGAIEAKKQGVSLSGIEAQSKKYSDGLPNRLSTPFPFLPFLYESTGAESYFTNGLDPKPRSRRVFAFHWPETLAEWIGEGKNTLRARLGHYPPLIETNLWKAQIQAINHLEDSLAKDKPRALIQMATGSGKTFTAVNYIYRMIKFGKVRRVLFLVDRSNLARQTLREFQSFVTPDDGRKFTELYNVQHLQSNTLDDVSKVCITTIQRLYSMLSGDPEFDPEAEEESLFEQDAPEQQQQPRTVTYNPTIPIEYFDVIVIDECHRSIYTIWRQVLEYFDAYLIGMTATPSKRAFGFFNANLVMEYTRAEAVLDGVNVDGQIYRIRTRITEDGSQIEAGEFVSRRDKKTRTTRMAQLDEDFTYAPTQLDFEAVSPNQLRTVIQTFKDRLFTEIFPGREVVPKTLIFAKDDSHAEDIVRMVREVFNEGNEFCKKITYRVSGVKPEDLIAEFRNSYHPRIAVTVDMIATGTDIKPVEILFFMRLVKSPILYEQMQGRGTRVINTNDLKAVTPDASEKTRFVIIDAVGVVEVEKAETPTLDTKRSVSFEKLLDEVAVGVQDDDTFAALAARLSRLERKLAPQDRARIQELSGGYSLNDIAHALLDAANYDKQIEATGQTDPTPQQIQAAATRLKQQAADLLKPKLRNFIKERHSFSEMVIDEISVDDVRFAGFADVDQAQAIVQDFRAFLETHRDEITALQILLNIPYGQLEWRHLKELAEYLRASGLAPEKVWAAYAQLEGLNLRSTTRLLTDLISLVRHAVDPHQDLIPYPDWVRARYEHWLADKDFNAEQRHWLDLIAEHIGVNLTIEPDDLNRGAFFKEGGQMGAIRAFGKDLPKLLQELNAVLAA